MSYLQPAKISPITLSVQIVLIDLPRLETPRKLCCMSLFSSQIQVSYTGIFSPQAEGWQWLVLLGQAQGTGLKQVKPSAQGLVSGLAGQLRMVIVLRQVAQNQESRLAIVIALQEFRQRPVGAMALFVHDALLDH